MMNTKDTYYVKANVGVYKDLDDLLSPFFNGDEQWLAQVKQELEDNYVTNDGMIEDATPVNPYCLTNNGKLDYCFLYDYILELINEDDFINEIYIPLLEDNNEPTNEIDNDDLIDTYLQMHSINYIQKENKLIMFND